MSDTLPYGIRDVAGPVELHGSSRIRCCHVGCGRLVRRRRRGEKFSLDAFCPDHGISTTASGRYVYADRTRNVFVARELLRTIQKQYPHQLASESSEDAVSWNVFVGLQRAGLLEAALALLTGEQVRGEAELYLWGNRILADSVQPWSRILDARKVLENRPGTPTEPDVVIRVPGNALVLIEAKLGSSNGTLDRKKKSWPTVRRWLDAYRLPSGVADPLDRERVAAMKHTRVLEQLCRNAVFAAWMRSPRERAWVVNLVRRQAAAPSDGDCDGHLLAGDPVAFRAARWEDLLPLASQATKVPLRRYLLEKSLNLRPAFEFPTEPR